MEDRTRGVKNSKGTITHYLGIIIDVTSRKEAELHRKRTQDRIKQSEEHYRGLLDNIPGAVFAIDLDGTFTFMSPAAEELIAYSQQEASSMKICQLAAPEYQQEVRNYFTRKAQGKIIPPMEIELIDARSKRIFVRINSSAVRDSSDNITGTIAIAQDITWQKDLESQLRQAQKMEAIGSMVDGIAHDFNNLLTAILGNLELTRKS